MARWNRRERKSLFGQCSSYWRRSTSVNKAACQANFNAISTVAILDWGREGAQAPDVQPALHFRATNGYWSILTVKLSHTQVRRAAINVAICTVMSHFASASRWLRPYITYRSFTLGPHWGTSFPRPSFAPLPSKISWILRMDSTRGTAAGPRVGRIR